MHERRTVRWPIIALLIAFPSLAQTAPAQTASDAITVTATRTATRVADTPASVVVLSRDTLDTTAAATADDALRQVPGFTLFRRSSSRVANPTTQGVSLRGIGASGASRALVLDDGIPLNDPFGGWIYWGRIAQPSIERVEVVRGGASDLYGSSAMGGVVQFVRRQPLSSATSANVTGGSQGTSAASMFMSLVRGRWRANISGDFFDTSGYVLVAPAQRGAIDRRAGSRHNALDATIARERFFLRASQYGESRNNGTPVQTNETTIRQIAAGIDQTMLNGSFVARGWLTDQDYAQTFSAIAANRASERLTADQRVPSRGSGITAQWSRPVGLRNAVIGGVEARQVSGASDEAAFGANGNVSTLSASGQQRTSSIFVEDLFMARPALGITAGLRYDTWRNFDASRNGLALAGRTEDAWSPRVALLFRAHEQLAFTASAYRAFRAPTLNELYRGFRAGNILTLSNESLGAERLSAIEAGARFQNMRATLFWMQMDDVVANVTLSVTPSLITRQRQNISSSRARGVEVEGEWRLGTKWRASAGYLFTDSIVTSGASNALNGRRLPQVPRNQVTAQLLYSAWMTVGMQARWSAMQFDDDLNDLRLRGYFVADLFMSKSLTKRLSIITAAENLFDRDVEAGATPVTTLGTPRAVRVGVRLNTN